MMDRASVCVCEEEDDEDGASRRFYETGRRCGRRFPLHEAESGEGDGGRIKSDVSERRSRDNRKGITREMKSMR